MPAKNKNQKETLRSFIDRRVEEQVIRILPVVLEELGFDVQSQREQKERTKLMEELELYQEKEERILQKLQKFQSPLNESKLPKKNTPFAQPKRLTTGDPIMDAIASIDPGSLSRHEYIPSATIEQLMGGGEQMMDEAFNPNRIAAEYASGAGSVARMMPHVPAGYQQPSSSYPNDDYSNIDGPKTISMEELASRSLVADEIYGETISIAPPM